MLCSSLISPMMNNFSPSNLIVIKNMQPSILRILRSYLVGKLGCDSKVLWWRIKKSSFIFYRFICAPMLSLIM